MLTIRNAILALPLASMALAGMAHAETPAPIMHTAGVAAAPAGFLDYCKREPMSCGDAGEVPSRPVIAARLSAASTLYWRTLFGATAVTPPPAAAPPSSKPAARLTGDLLVKLAVGLDAPLLIRIAPIDSAADEASGQSAVSAAHFAVEIQDAAVMGSGPGAVAAGDVASAAAPTEPELAPARTYAMDRAGWSLINTVNRRVNRQIRRVSDLEQFGVNDVWSAPEGRNARGDCEDYVLAKRRDLIAAGVPAETLSIAVVETRWGEGHAVLLISADKGEYVLDSLNPWVERWDRVDYHWIARQTPGHALDWANIAA